MARLIPIVLLLAAAAAPSLAQDEHFKKAGVCGRCHVISVVEWGISRHAAAGTGCVACHGASEGHVIDERNNVKPERIPRGAASAALCRSCHTAGCPKSKKTDQCSDCHHFHALIDPAKPAAAKDDRTDRIAATWKEADRHIAEGERLAALQQWGKARDEFRAALAGRPSDARVQFRLAYCERRLNPAMQGFEAVDKELDIASGLPRRVRVAGLGIEMVLIPSGEADIGAERFRDSAPVHTVRVEPFYLGKYEVTQADWAGVMGTAAPGVDAASKAAGNISWDDAVQFVKRLNARVPGAGFRLPSEAEWEYAARVKPGVNNMRGGMWEWCSTLFAPYPYRADDGRESASATGLRVLRGGGDLDTEDLRDPAFRHAERPSRRMPFNGLRLARSVSPIAAAEFAYSPSWWQSVISLPDDTDKVVVGKEGQLLFDFIGKGLRNFGVKLQLEVSGEVQWKRQETDSPRVPIVRTVSDAAGVEVIQEVFMVPASERRILMIASLKNTTTEKATRRIGLTQTGKNAAVSSTEGATSGLELVLAPAESREIVFTIDRKRTTPTTAVTIEQAQGLRDAARGWWENSGLPFDAIQVPDPSIQAMIESSVRNIWQARDIEGGKIAFKVGPTVYRKLFVVDGAFLLEAAAMLGRAKDARDGLEFILGHQEADGAFEVIRRYYGVKGFWKENGIVLWAVFRHAQLSQDKEWLRAKWPALRRIVDVIRSLRSETLKNPNALEFGLLPAGFIDGGIDNRLPGSKPEYSNVYWSLIGWKAAIAAAHWLGEHNIAATWQPEFDDFYSAYRKAAARDTLKDAHGNAYVPTMMANADAHPAARGQWAFCQAVYPGGVFERGDPLVEGQLEMLRATKVEGMVFDTGWMKEGLWNYFASFYAHAMLWQGHGREAANALYDFARHASPVRTWREEQKPLGKGEQEVGDMPHNWASAEFIRLAVHLIELDRGDELHLLEGFPREWAAPGMVTRLNGVETPFGPLRMELRVALDGRSARLKLARLTGQPKRIVLHLSGLTGEDKTRPLAADTDTDTTIPFSNGDLN